jgi:hypothetical protein
MNGTRFSIRFPAQGDLQFNFSVIVFFYVFASACYWCGMANQNPKPFFLQIVHGKDGYIYAKSEM